MHAPTFSAYLHAGVWDYTFVLDQAALVQAQNEPLSAKAVGQLRLRFREHQSTCGWPGNTQHRFAGNGHAILIWAGARHADWFVGARDAESLEAALRNVWNLDAVGQQFYDCSEIAKAVLNRVRGEA